MAKKPTAPDDPAKLRRHAEALLRKASTKPAPNRSEADTQRLLHELEVHQIELEMQNAELQKARDELEVALEKYTDLYDFAPVGYLTLDQVGAILEANLAGASLLGVERSALLNRRLGLFIPMPERRAFADFLEKVFERKARQSCEVTLLIEGKPPFDVRMEAIVFESGRACRVALTDITERKRAENDRLVLNKLECTGILAGGIAHDFNNLLTIISLNLELAKTLTPPGEELARLVEEATKTAFLARGLTRQLVTFSEGGAPIRKSISLIGVLQESSWSALSGSGVTCEFSLADNLWPAEVDEGQIGQVIRNMVLNAREATPAGGVVSVRAENVVLSTQENPSLPPGEYVQLNIADRGRGISKEVLPKIFDPYFSTKKRGDQKGMGLGLTICHAVIQKHGGAIVVKSELGVGTTFQIYLPVSRKLSGEEKASVTKSVPRPRRILVMDDEEGIRRVIGNTLRQMGHDVELAADGRMAVELYGNAKRLDRPFHAVILDLMVRGGMGGQETIQALLRIDPSVKAIVMSGYATDPVIVEHQRHGFSGALEKPFNLGQLRDTVSRILGS